MNRVLYICLVFDLLTIRISAWLVKHKLVEAENGSHFLLDSDGVALSIPDMETTTAIAKVLHVPFGPSNPLEHVDDLDLANYSVPSPRVRRIQSQKMYADNPDENLRVLAQMAEIVEYPRFWLWSKKLGAYMNPSIVQWHNKTLLIYRNSYSYKVTTLSWMRDDLKGVDPAATYLGIRSGYMLSYDGNQEDPRGLVLSDGSLLITYGSTTPSSCHIKYVIGTVDAAGKASFSQSVQMRYTNKKLQQPFEKNWISFEYNGSVNFFTHLNPYTVVEFWRSTDDVANATAVGHDSAETPVMIPASGSSVTGVDVASTLSSFVQPVYGFPSNLTAEERRAATTVPWLGKYGDRLRGGTPAITVPAAALADVEGEEAEAEAVGGIVAEEKVLLTFFHTNKAGVQRSAPYRHTYFIGAAALCPRPPFNLLRTSMVPTMDYVKFYTGKWLFNSIDYVLFPTGILLKEEDLEEQSETTYVGTSSDSKNSSSSNGSSSIDAVISPIQRRRNYVYVTMGHQDHDGYILKFELDGLLRSLHFHSNCDPDANPRRKVLIDMM